MVRAMRFKTKDKRLRKNAQPILLINTGNFKDLLPLNLATFGNFKFALPHAATLATMDLQTLTASAVASTLTEIVFHPLDTVLTLHQTNTGNKYILPWRAYWKGLVPSIALTTPGFMIYMVAYRQSKDYLTPYLGESSLANYAVSGGIAELLSCSIWTPLDVLKGRMQLAPSGYKTMDLIKDIYHNEGMRGFFRGYWMGLAVFLPQTIVWWVTYEESKKWFESREKPGEEIGVFAYGASSAAATITSCASLNLLSVLKTRQQLAMAKEVTALRPDDHQSIFKVARNLIKDHGLFRAWFKGLPVRLAHHLPASVFGMILMEKLAPDTQQSRDEKRQKEEGQF